MERVLMFFITSELNAESGIPGFAPFHEETK